MLELAGLSKRYGDVVALEGLSFSVESGAIYGFVGANGAGKTTAMRIVLGVLAADAGEVRWQGKPIDRATRRRIGYMPEERGLYPKMRVHDQLVYLARLHGLSHETADANVSKWLDRMGLGERRDDTLESLSLGNQQRVQLVAALVHEPELLVLDEPFSGLDPVGVEVLADALTAESRERALPVIFSSHQLDLVERICDGVAIINRGASSPRARSTSCASRAPSTASASTSPAPATGGAGWRESSRSAPAVSARPRGGQPAPARSRPRRGSCGALRPRAAEPERAVPGRDHRSRGGGAMSERERSDEGVASVRLVAEREMRETWRSKYFRGSLLVMVLLVAAVVIIASLVGGDGSSSYKVGEVEGDPAATAITDQAEKFASEEGAELETISFLDRAAAEAAVSDDDVDVALDGRTLITQPDSDETLVGLLKAADANVETAKMLAQEGLDPGQIERALSPPQLEAVEIDEDEGEASALAFYGGLLLYISLLFMGYAVSGGIVEEKSSRVIELLLSAIRPIHALVGKLIGVGLLGLLQVLTITGVGLGLSLALGELDLPSSTASSVLLILLFFVLGYALYGCAFAAAGAMVSRQEDVQSSTSPLMLVLVAGYILSFTALDDPSGPLAKVMSFLPPTAPLVVPGRAAKDALPLGELLISVALMLVAIFVVAQMGARIYERAILRMGTPLSFREAFRLLRRSSADST